MNDTFNLVYQNITKMKIKLGLIQHKHISYLGEKGNRMNILKHRHKNIKARDLVKSTNIQLKHGNFNNMKLPATNNHYQIKNKTTKIY